MVRVKLTFRQALFVAGCALVYLGWVFVTHCNPAERRAAEAQRAEYDTLWKQDQALGKQLEPRRDEAIRRCQREVEASLAKLVPDAFALATRAPASALPNTQLAPLHKDNPLTVDFAIDDPQFGSSNCWPREPTDTPTTARQGSELLRASIANRQRRLELLDSLHPPDVLAAFDLRCSGERKCDAAVVWVSRGAGEVLAVARVSGVAKAQLAKRLRDVIAAWKKRSA